MRFMKIVVVAMVGVLGGTLPVGAVPRVRAGGSLRGVVKHASVKKAPTLVYIDEMPGKDFKPPAKNPVMDQKGKVFFPRVMPVLVGTTVDFLNSDDFEHNVFSPDGETYNLGNFGKDARRSHTFTQAGIYVQLCKVHPEMVAYIIALKTPYFALADEEGKYQMADVPSGTWKVKIWNEKLKPKQLEASTEAKVEEGKETELDLKP